jgi:hypothetical protein
MIELIETMPSQPRTAAEEDMRIELPLNDGPLSISAEVPVND